MKIWSTIAARQFPLAMLMVVFSLAGGCGVALLGTRSSPTAYLERMFLSGMAM